MHCLCSRLQHKCVGELQNSLIACFKWEEVKKYEWKREKLTISGKSSSDQTKIETSSSNENLHATLGAEMSQKT